MSDPLTLGLASTAVGLVNGTINLLKEAREAAKRSDDHDLKETLNGLYDAFLDIKEVVGNLRDENEELRRKLNEQEKLEWNPKAKLYFKAGDSSPFCPACWDDKRKSIRLHDITELEYVCNVCNKRFWKLG